MKIPIFPGKYHQNAGIFQPAMLVSLQECTPTWHVGGLFAESI